MQLYTAKEACSVLKISKTTLDKLVKAKDINAMKLNSLKKGTWRYDVDEFLARKFSKTGGTDEGKS